MNEIELDNLIDDNDTIWWGDASTTAVAYKAPNDVLTIEKLSEMWEELNGPPIIKVWKGDFLPVTTEYPQFHKNSIIGKDKAYIVAGVGIVCGEDAYEYIWNQGFLAVWTNEPPE